MARRADRQRAARHRRHRPRVGRRRLAFRPRAAARQHRHAERVATTSSRRGCRSRAMCWKRLPPTWNSPTAASGSRAPTARSGIFEVARAALRAQRSAGRAARAAARRKRRDRQPRQLSPMAAMSARSRSIPTPVSSRSCAIPRSTMCGRAVNPMIVHGQIHGGITHGVGQALCEYCVYEPRHRPAAVRLADGLRDAAGRPLPSSRPNSAKCRRPTHPLGIRPAGEGGTTPALGVVINAIVDALAEFGVDPHRNAGHPGARLARHQFTTETQRATRIILPPCPLCLCG